MPGGQRHGRRNPAGIDIFAAFTTTQPAGTGLVLAVARQIVEAHKGTLTYHTAPGQGTTFAVTPLVD